MRLIAVMSVAGAYLSAGVLLWRLLKGESSLLAWAVLWPIYLICWILFIWLPEANDCLEEKLRQDAR